MESIITTFVTLNEDEKKQLLTQLLNHCGLSTLNSLTNHITPLLKRDFIARLPQEIVVRICTYLDFQTVCRMMLVSKEWNSKLNDKSIWRYFWRVYPNHEKYYSEIEEEENKSRKELFKANFILKRNWKEGKCKVRTLRGHTRSVFCVCIYKNYIVSASYDETLKIWDLQTGECLRTLMGHSKGVTSCLMFGSKIISASCDYSIKIWDFETGTCEKTLAGHFGEVCSLSIDQWNQRWILVSAACDYTIIVWDLTQNQILHRLIGHEDYVISAQLKDGIIVSGSFDCDVRIWNLETGQCEKVLSLHKKGIKSVRFNNEIIVSGGMDKQVIIWDYHTGLPLKVLLRESAIWNVQLEVNTYRLLITVADGDMYIWDWKTGEIYSCSTNENKHQNTVTFAQFNRFMIASSSFDKTIKVWDFRGDK